jgi:hypothetical protein
LTLTGVPMALQLKLSNLREVSSALQANVQVRRCRGRC